MRRALTTSVLLFALTSTALPDPLGDLTPNGGEACFRRVYDEAHLRRLPRQQVTAMTVWLNGKIDNRHGGNMGLAITRRSERDPLFLSGDCSWSDFGKPPEWMPSFKKRAGAGCVTLAVPDVFANVSSAEEGGAVLLDPAPDGQSMMVHLDDAQVMVKRAKRGTAISVKLGADDRVFRLSRTDLSACDGVKDAVTTPERN